MEFFRISKDIPFMRHARVFNIISFSTFVIAVLLLLFRGLNLSVEFTGGTLIELRYQQAQAVEPVREALTAAGYGDFLVQNFGSARDILIRLPNPEQEEDSKNVGERVLAAVSAKAEAPPELRRVEFVGPQVGKELASDGAMALLLVIFGTFFTSALFAEILMRMQGIV